MNHTSFDWVTDTFQEGGLLDQTVPNYKVRPQQVQLSKMIQKSIETRTPIVAEGPTGVGKSLAALVPSFEHIKRTDEPVIVATSSIILQEQYIHKDIPLLEKLLNFSTNPVLIKGRNNYLCPKKLNDAQNGKAHVSTSDQAKEFEEVLKWGIQTKTGDKSELDFVPKHAVWSKFACIENNECTGKQCSFYSVCPYYRERNKIQTSKLVVTNYHYLFSALNAPNMLPQGAKVIIMDEGHEVNAIARDFQERKYALNALKSQFDFFAKSLERAQLSDIGDSAFGLMDEMELDLVNGTLADMFVGLTHEYKRVVRGHYTRDFWQIEVPERTRLQKYVTAHIEALDLSVSAASRYLEKFGFSMENLSAIVDMFGEEAAEWFIVVLRTMELLQEKSHMLRYIFAYEPSQDDKNDIFWLEKYQDGVSVHAKPTTGAGLTQPLFEKKEDGFVPIVMSATLSANQSFEHIKCDFGISTEPERYPVNELIVSSPFELDKNLLWYLPANTPEGKDSEHLWFVLDEMSKMISALQGRTLCLFTSRKNLLEATAYFNKVLPRSIHLVSQEDMPKQKIIDFMKANDNTVVLGTKSFFTGIDIQGPHLSAVLIDKFPFPMIGDPINDYLMSQPRGFHTYSLPEAVIALKQGFGRLNRTATDRGIVAVYDGRLATATYKNKIFNSFDFKIQATKSWAHVMEYIKDITHQQEE